MIVVYSCDGRLQADRIANATMAEDVLVVGTWEELTKNTRRSAGIVVDCKNLTPELTRNLLHLGSVALDVPVLLTISRDARGLDQLSKLILAAVIWSEELEVRMPVAIAGIDIRYFLLNLARVIERADHLPPPCRAAMVCALRSDPPVLYVRALARKSLVSRSNLGKGWRIVFGANCQEPDWSPTGSGAGIEGRRRIEDFLATICLGHAIVRRGKGTPWAQVVAELGVSEKTIRKHARTVKGLSPGLNKASDEAAFRDHLVHGWIPFVHRLNRVEI